MNLLLRACSHGGGGPRKPGEVPRHGGVINLSIQSLFISWSRSHVKWGTSPRRVARSTGAGNSLSWCEFSPCECWGWGRVMFILVIVSEFWILPKPAKTTWLLISTSVASFFAEITFKTSTKAVSLKKVLKKLMVHLWKSDNQADLPVFDEAEVVPVRTTKRKASSD